MKYCLTFLLFFLFIDLFSQEVFSLEQYLETLPEEISAELSFEEWQYFLEHPLNINTATEEDLIQLPLLNDFQIQSLIEYRRFNGPLLSIYELLSIDNFDRETIQQIIPFITVEKLPKKQRKKRKSTFTWMQQRIREQKAGYDPSQEGAYLGSPDRFLFRYRYQHNHWKAGFTADKDPGENPFDHYAAYASVSNFGNWKKVIVGDYHLQIGQGLTYWSGYAFNNLYDPLRTSSVLQENTSSDEYRFLRGMAFTYWLKGFKVTPFVSYKSLSASLDSLDGKNYVKSIYTAGYHRTEKELLKKNKLKELLYGVHARYNKNNWSIGLTGLSQSHHLNFLPATALYKKHNMPFVYASGVDYRFSIQKMNGFGEFSLNERGWKLLQGIKVYAGSKLNYFLSYYQDKQVNHQKVLTMGIQVFPLKKLNLKAVLKQERYDWLRYRVDALSQGWTFSSRIDWELSRKQHLYLNYVNRMRMENESAFALPQLQENEQRNIRLHYSYRLQEQWEWRSRVELVMLTKQLEKGIVLYQDLIYKSRKFPLKCSFRYALIETSSYASRIYAYENDVLGSFSIPAYYGKNIHMYWNVHYKISEHIDTWLKISRSVWADRETVGSGLEEIQGNSRTELKLQCRYWF